MGSSAHRVLAIGLVLAPAAALAQSPSGAAGGAGPAQQQQQPQGNDPAAAGSALPAKPKGNTEGFTFSDKPARRAAGPAGPVVAGVRASRRGPIATMPGFEETSDGGSRLFVTLTQTVPVEERRAQGVLTYVLKGAHVTRLNNTNALVTVHFNTPVARARLVPHGNDLLFIVDMRAAATPTFKVAENADHTAMLTIDFAKGDFAGAATTPAPGPDPKRLGKQRGSAAPAPAQGDSPVPADAPQGNGNGGSSGGGGGTGPQP